MHRGRAIRPGAMMLFLRQALRHELVPVANAQFSAGLVAADTLFSAAGPVSAAADKFVSAAEPVAAHKFLSAAGPVVTKKLLSAAGAVSAAAEPIATDKFLSAAGAASAAAEPVATYKFLSAAGPVVTKKVLSTAVPVSADKIGAGFRSGIGMALSGRGWAAGITSRNFSSDNGRLGGWAAGIDCGEFPKSLELESLTENQIYLMQLMNEYAREAQLQRLEIEREELFIADEIDRINALDRDALTESCRMVGVTVWRLFVALGGGFIFFWKKGSC